MSHGEFSLHEPMLGHTGGDGDGGGGFPRRRAAAGAVAVVERLVPRAAARLLGRARPRRERHLAERVGGDRVAVAREAGLPRVAVLGRRADELRAGRLEHPRPSAHLALVEGVARRAADVLVERRRPSDPARLIGYQLAADGPQLARPEVLHGHLPYIARPGPPIHLDGPFRLDAADAHPQLLVGVPRDEDLALRPRRAVVVL